MNAVQRKLQDRSGATLTVALLFFIMCAAAGSVILAAATTSTGRLAELQASDQNYYAVVSAAKLLRDEIDGQTIGVKQTETKTTTVTTSTDNGGTPDDTSDDTIVEETKITYTYSSPTFVYGTKDAHTNKLEFVDAIGNVYLLKALTCTSKNEAGAAQKRSGSLTNVYKTLNGSDSYISKKELSESAQEYSDSQEAFASPLMNGTDRVYTDSFTITASLKGFTLEGSAASALPVDVRIVMNGQGNIKAYIKNHLDAGAKNQGNEYRLMLTLDAKEGAVQEDSSSGTSEDGSGSPSTTKDGDTTTTTESTSVTRHSYVTWGNPQITKDTSKDVW